LTDIILPKGDKLETIQASATLLGSGNLKSINFEDATGLKEIAITNAAITEIDLTTCTNLTSLKMYTPKTRLQTIKGAKELKKLVSLNVRGNALGFDQIPDFISSVSDTDDWDYSRQGNVPISSDKINGNSINVSHLLKAKGIADTEQTTTFVWRWKVAKEDDYMDVPDSCISYKDGIYTFDNNALQSAEFRVFFRATNTGFPGAGSYVKTTKTCNDYISSLGYVLDHPLTVIQTVSEQHGFSFAPTDGGVRLTAGAPVQAAIYSMAGQQVWSGTAPATVSLPKGCYVVKPASGKAAKFVVK